MTESNQLTSNLFTIYALAHLFELDHRTVKKRLLAADLAPESERNGTPVYRLKEAAAYLVLRPALADGTIDPTKLAPRELAYWEQAQHTRVRREALQGTLLPAEDCRDQLAWMAKTILPLLETLPEIAERDAGATPQQRELFETVINTVRQQIYERLTEDESDEKNSRPENGSSRVFLTPQPEDPAPRHYRAETRSPAAKGNGRARSGMAGTGGQAG